VDLRIGTFIEQFVRLAYQRLRELETQDRRIEPVKIRRCSFRLLYQRIEQLILTTALVAENELLLTLIQNKLPSAFFHSAIQSPDSKQVTFFVCRGTLVVQTTKAQYLKLEAPKDCFRLFRQFDNIEASKSATRLLSANNTAGFTN
jgi:hypothetical protein